MPKDLQSAATAACGTLNNPQSRPTIIIVDALNQFDEDEAARLVSWVPRKLAPHIRCVFSMIPDTPQHKALTSREPAPQVMQLGPLDKEEKTVSFILDFTRFYTRFPCSLLPSSTIDPFIH